MERFDAIVVGAGPAGSTAARELAAGGARVLIVDRAEFPRYKACGGGIPIRTQRLLSFPIESVIEDSVHRMEVTYRGKMRFVRDSGTPFAHMVMRDRFDNLLLEEARRAGAEFRPRTVVRSAETTGGRVSISSQDGFTAEARFLICADGAHSPVGKMAGLGAGMAECAAWEVEVKSGNPRRPFEGTTLIEFGYRPWGYAWLFPKADLLSFGIVIPPGQAGTMKQRVSKFIERTGWSDGEVEIAKGHKIRFRRGHEPIASDRVLLAGDSAGLADEFTEEGIFYAIQSGRVAARATLRALAASGTLRPYEADIDAEIMPELRAARVIGAMFYGMLLRAPRPWIQASRHIPWLWSALFAVQRGESTYFREVQRARPLAAIASRRLDRADRVATRAAAHSP